MYGKIPTASLIWKSTWVKRCGLKHINKIEYIDDKLCRVILDTFDVLELDTFTVSTSPLIEGQDVEDEVLERVVFDSECVRAHKEAIKFLNLRMRTQKQIGDKLKEKGFSEEIIASTVEKLGEWGYTDDAAYAREYIIYRLNGSKKSWRAIFYDLKLEGVDKEIIQSVAGEFDTDETLRAMIVAEKILGQRRDEKSLKKLQGTLQRNGFYWDAISYVMSRLGMDETEEY